MNLLLANASYKLHGTDEGNQLQVGLEQSGWTLAGYGYDGCTHVPTLLDRYKPSVVLSHDQCDWHPDWPGCFDPECAFEDIECLADRSDIYKVVVVKDSGTMLDEKRALAKKIKADTALLYYHPTSALKLAPWLAGYRMVRTWHSIDSYLCRPVVNAGQDRARAIVSGAIGDCYPIRAMVAERPDVFGVEVLRHPGYGNIGNHSQGYLQSLSNFKVHLATASDYGFALRKIIESVAVGCTPVTNLPAYDVLPEIDEALVRISMDPTMQEVKDAIDHAEMQWSIDRAMHFARQCWEFYDWRVSGERLSKALETP